MSELATWPSEANHIPEDSVGILHPDIYMDNSRIVLTTSEWDIPQQLIIPMLDYDENDDKQSESDAQSNHSEPSDPDGSPPTCPMGSRVQRSPKKPRFYLPKPAIREIDSWLIAHPAEPYPPESQKDVWSQRWGIPKRNLNIFLTNHRKRVLRTNSSKMQICSIPAWFDGKYGVIQFLK